MEEEVGGSGFLVGRRTVEEDRWEVESWYEATWERRRVSRDEQGDHDGRSDGGRRTVSDGRRTTDGGGQTGETSEEGEKLHSEGAPFGVLIHDGRDPSGRALSRGASSVTL